LLQLQLQLWPTLSSDLLVAAHRQEILILYSTSACHLCEQAEVILKNVLPSESYYLDKKDIVLNEELMDRYGAFIPVLVKENENGVPNELFWPFDENKVRVFLIL